jgi:hypothetical protein
MRRPAARPRGGFSYIEVVVASVVFAITTMGLGATMVAQEKIMRAVESRCHVVVPLSCTLRVTASGGGYVATVEDALPVLPPAERTVLGRVPYWLDRLYGPTPATLVTLEGRADLVPEAGHVVRPVRFTDAHAAPLSVAYHDPMEVEPGTPTDTPGTPPSVSVEANVLEPN